jgi:hypothetical protein
MRANSAFGQHSQKFLGNSNSLQRLVGILGPILISVQLGSSYKNNKQIVNFYLR